MNVRAYAAYNKNEAVRNSSSSGAIFSVLASYILSEKGIIYGVSMSADCYSAEFIRVKDETGLERLRGSKYFQAKVGDAFKSVKEDLLGGKKVLFSGTGCQINGLKAFLQKNYDNLICVDVICHGTPSPKLWREYAEYQESKHGKLESVNFRCKDDSRIDYGMKENHLYVPKNIDSFMRMFLRNYCLRPACYECHAKYYKTADLTIADFWGIENVAPELNDGMGTSLVITRTERGQELFDRIKDKLKWKEVSYKDGVRGNPSEYASATRPKERDTFFNDLSTVPFEEMEKKYAADMKGSLLRKVVRKVKSLVKGILGGYTKVKHRSNTDYGVLFTFRE